MDNKNKFTASLNAYMAKHKLNTNATSAAMGVSVPTLRKALRGQSVSRKTAAKIESIIKSGKVPAEAHKTATKAPAKKTAPKKPAASKQVKPAATAKQPAAKAKQTKSAEQVSVSKPATTPKASRVQTKRAANQQSQATSQTPTAPQTEAAASSKPARRTAKRVTRSTVTSRQNQRPNNQQEHNNNEQAPKQTPVQKRIPTRQHRFTIRQQPDVATQEAEAEAKKRQTEANRSSVSASSSSSQQSTEQRHDNQTERHIKKRTVTAPRRNVNKTDHEPARRDNGFTRNNRNKPNGNRQPNRTRQNRFAANADPQNWQPMTQPAASSASQSMTAKASTDNRHVPAVVNHVETHTPSVIRSTSNDRNGKYNSANTASSSTSDTTSQQATTGTNMHTNYGTHDEAPLVAGKQLQLFIDESFEEHRPDPRTMHMGIAAIFPEGDDDSLIGFRNALYPYGWEPGDEVKARGKQVDALTQLIKAADHENMGMYTVFSQKTTYPDFAPSMEYLYPYIGATIHVLRDVDTTFDSIVIMIDHRNELEGNQLVMGADIVSRYLTLSLERPIKVRFEFADSREHLGLQLSDFVANAALRLSNDELSLIGITPMPELGVSQHDQLVRLTLLGLQQVVMGVRAERAATPSKHSQPDRFMQLIFDATYADSDQVRGALPVVKNAVEQLIDVLPNARVGQISGMPNQSWYDMTARMAGLLRYINKDPKPYGRVLAKIESVTKTAADELEMALDSDDKAKH